MSLVDVARERARAHPDRVVYRFLSDGETEGARLAFGELDRRAEMVAALLRSEGARGERVLLLYPAGLEFVVGFLGCLYAGAVAVPAYPPRTHRPDPRLRALAEDARPRFALASEELCERAEGLAAEIPQLAEVRWLATEALDPGADGPDPGGGDAGDLPAPTDLAFLQYTSGSTSTPKGVAVRHDNLLHNQSAIRDAFGQTEESVIVGWLPLYHDMGLIGNVLQPLYTGATCVLMPPVAFLQRPARWLEAIDRYRATTSGGPDFAYDLCARKVAAQDVAGLDLSCWSVAFDGAEPVRAETLERFAAAFAPAGFRREAFFPCYGLAEATLFVTGAGRDRPPRVLELDAQALERDEVRDPAPDAPVRSLVACGPPASGQSLVIAHRETGEPVAPGAVGEIRVAGPSVADGYWRRPEESQRTFRSRVPGRDERYLRTGDLGFVEGGELFVTGRLKDLIIVRGRNLYPQDVERTAEAVHPALRPGGGAAFSVEAGGEERLVVVHEVERSWRRKLDGVPDRLVREVAEEHQVPVEAVVLVPPGGVPRTTSGKVRRRACRAAYLEGRLRPLGEWRRGESAVRAEGTGRAPATATEERLAEVWAEVFELDAVDVEADFFALGGDSLKATVLAARIERAFGVELPLDALFEAPSIAALAQVLEATEGPVAQGEAPPLAALPPERRSRPLPLSFAQRRLWFLHRLDPGNPVHNIAASVGIAGPLDVAALRRAFGEILRRHEALRSGFVDPFAAADGAGGPAGAEREPVQVVHPAPRPELSVVDLSGLAEGHRGRCARALASGLARRPFDLERGPFLRTVLLREGRGEHRLVVAFHHVAADGWSLEVFLRETAVLYEAFRHGRPSPLPALAVQYADFAVWQRRWLRGDALERRLAYWRSRLAGRPGATELPADRPRPPLLSHRGAHLERVVPAALADALEALARRQAATPFMALLTGFLIVLARYTGQDDLIVGTPISGRTRAETEGLIGVFINNLVLRVDASGDPGFDALLGRVRQASLGAFAHQDVPFETLVDTLAPERDLSRTPLFQIVFVGQNAPLGRMEAAGLAFEPREIDPGAARFDLALSMAPVAEGRLGTWKYATDLFDRTTVERMARHLETVLAGALADPARPLSELPLAGPAERQGVLLEWNDTRRAYPPERAGACLHRLIAEQAGRTPDAVAVSFHESGRGADLPAELPRALTYRGLLARARALAGRLRALGVGPESRVGVAADRSPEMVVGLVAVLEAGAAFVPLDPGYPRDRLAFMMADAALAALLVQPHLEASLPEHAVPMLALEPTPAAEPDGVGSLGPAVYPESPAYAIYTSGSTGRPKGAAISHAAIVNRLLWMQEAYGLVGGDRVLQKTPFSFDVSVWELFWPLVTGARLVMAPPGVHRDPGRLARAIEREGITTLHFVPSMLQVFLDQQGLEEHCRSVRRVITSGEALPFGLAERCLERSGAELHNLYGPTEAAVDVSAWSCRPGGPNPVPIGRPIANLTLHVADRRLRPAPAGLPGELLIGGAGLARGYLGRSALTAERFVPDPFAAAGAGGRLYRTGDLARHRTDSAIEFLGRLDHQVKVRGFRIELGEVESALLRHPDVREVVVVARTDLPGDTRLVAYLVPAPSGAPSVHDLREHLGRRLPEYMVPAAFVVLDELPLTPSGKVDRRALPQPALERTALPSEYVAPRSPLERRLAALWEDLLDVERIGAHADFFALGGDSIQGAMLVNRLQRELGEIVYVMALFDAPTVAELAALLERTYPRAAARLGGRAAAPAEGMSPEERERALGPEGLDALRLAVARRIRPRAQADGAAPPVADTAAAGPRNRPAVFLLSPFRSGSTLLRVMLAGHPRLFAPPELELLGFPSLGARRLAYAGRDAFALEGLLRAVMELAGVDAERAREIVGLYESQDLSTGAFYHRLQEWIGDRLLVDKTPSYALDRGTLGRAEELFEAPLYVHLVRHPAATVRSYVEARMDRVYRELPHGPREQGELVWRLAHRNVLDHLDTVPASRWLRVRFEDLVREPRATMEQLCAFLGVPFDPATLEPYQGERMTDGLHAESRMMGDPKFHRHQAIDPEAAERRSLGGPGSAADPLHPDSCELAAVLGYAVAEGTAPTPKAGADQAPKAGADQAPKAGADQAPKAHPDQAPSLAPAAVAGEDHPLSFAQERLWFITQLEPAGAAYNMPAAIRLEGGLDRPALARAFSEVVRRHRVLRTSFPSVDGAPVQRIARRARVGLPVADLSGLPPERAREAAERLAEEAGRRPFDLFAPAGGSLLRAGLARIAAREHLLVVTLHHIASDGWSIGVLIRELAALYRAFSHGDPSPLPELPFQYADFAVWQRRWLTGDALESHLAYWRERLDGRLPPLELPTDRPRPPVQTFRGERRSARLAPAASKALHAWSRTEGTTPFLVLLAAFNALLVRYTQQGDLLLGIPVANRNRVEIEGLIGFFLNMVVQRTDASGAPTFRELLARVRAGFLGSTAHHEVPFEKVVEAVQPRRDLSRSPIFQVQFSLQNTPMAPLELPGLTLTPLEIHNRTTKFDLTVFLFDEPEGLRTTLEYNADLFDGSTLERLLAHWGTLLAAAVAAPDTRLPELALLTAGERLELTRGHDDRRAAFADEPPVHRLFFEQAAERPGAPAVIHEVEEIAYGELARRASRLARRLRALGVGPDVPVGLCAERSIDMMVGILGILEAGGAYVPLDPALPEDRLDFMIEDALSGVDAPLVVAQERFAERVAGGGARRLVLLDAVDDGEPAAGDEAPPAAAPGPANLAYVIYTSGSTGRPKGVQVTHGNVVRLLRATEGWFGFGPDDVWTLFHSYGFDFSVWEIWGALAYGGRLVLVSKDVARSPEAFHHLLATEGVTVLNQTPSAFRQLARVHAEEGFPPLSLRWVIFGGEALDPSVLAPWIAHHGHRRPRSVNMYGITETTVHVTWRPIAPADLDRPGASPVGVPIPDLSVRVLGPWLEPVPTGAAGEMFVGGAGLARGYLGRPALTAERFVPDPFATRPGERLYRSGDLARRRSDGDLEYLGRIDHQVKIRGFRIELGEIEAALADHPGVAEAAVVVAPGGSPDDRRLAAYVVSHGPVPPIDALRAHLRERLPDYMVPAHFVPLDRLPLTPTGKLDRRALPDPATAEAGVEGLAAGATPRTATERRLAAVWREVLRLDRSGRPVGVHDDFFDLGGHSLLATQLISRVRAACGVDLPMAAVFETPTIAGLARRIDGLLPEPAEAPGPPPIEPGPRDGAAPLSFAQERLWFLDQLDPGSPLYNVSSAFRLSGELSAPAFARTLAEVVRRHEALRTRFRSEAGGPVQEVLPRAALPLPVVDLSSLPEPWRQGELARRAQAEARRPFDLGRAPLFRAILVRLGPREHAVLATLHHVVSDGWSVAVLIREVAALYAALVAGEPSPLPPLPVQYSDFAAWQREWLAGDALAEELEHWRAALEGAPTALELPADRPRPPVQGFRGFHLPVALPAPLAGRVRRLARAEGATPFMVLLAAFQVLLARLSGRLDLLVGSPVANRNRVEVEGLIGFFVNTLVLRGRLAGEPSLRALLARVREATLDAFTHQDLPFERLVERLEPERDLSRSPLVQVLFVLQNAPTERLELPGLTLEPMPVESGTSKFDLTLSLAEAPEPSDDAGLDGFLEASADLFDRATVARWWGHWRTLLEAAVAEPGRGIEDLPLLTRAERHQLVTGWNPPAPAAPVPAPVHETVLRRCRETPDAIAVVAGGAAGERTLSYGELDRRSGRWAVALRRDGIGLEARVAVACERSPEMVTALVAVLRAGAAYVPLDAGQPRERLAAILEDAAPAAVVADAASLDALGPGLLDGLRVIRVDALAAAPSADAAAEAPAPAVPAAALAYTIFTSGSTGRPKGVQVPHGAFTAFLAAMAAAPGLDRDDSLLAVTTLGFDIAGLELFLPLMNGARTVLAGGDEAADGAALARLLARSRATAMQATPATWRLLLDAGWEGAPALVALCGGEALPGALAARLAERVAGLWNVYGPTETTVWSSRRQVLPGELELVAAAAVPLGRPIEGTAVVVLDPRGEPAPVGVPGELWIGGAGVARGYVRSPGLTAERFRPDPLAAAPAAGGARCYRTGDLARRLPDGDLEFLGRLDQQVKVRGFRIELGEVEAALVTHPAVEQAVVTAQGSGADRRLVAFVVARPSAGEVPPAPAELREHLHARVPDYMVPSAFALLDAFPLNASGKVDRGALARRKVASAGAVGRRPYVAPRDPAEELVAGLWRELLEVDRVGAHDGFFELGGHSLLATRLLARLRRATGVEVPVRRLFDDPTVAGLAAAVARAGREDRADGPPPLRPRSAHERTRPVPLSYAQERLWFLERLEPGSPWYNLPIAFRLCGGLAAPLLDEAVARVVARHEALRTAFVTADDQPFQTVEAPAPASLPRIDLAGLPATRREPELSRLARAEARRPFDLDEGPLLRLRLVQLGERDHAMLGALHHIVGDGGSLGILARELGGLYRALAAGRSAELPDLPVQYADFCLWQRRWLDGPVLEELLGFWRRELDGAPRSLDLPADRPRPAVRSALGHKVPFRMSAARVAALRRLGAHHGGTLFMILAAAFGELLRRYTGQDDMLLGLPVANRSPDEVEDLIGLFVNTVVLRVRAEGDPTVPELLGRVREATLGALAHQELPFERLVADLAPERDRSRSPLFQVMVALQEDPARHAAPERDGGLTLEPLEVDTGTAHFDWNLSLVEGADGLGGFLEVASDLFDAVTARRTLAHLATLLEALPTEAGDGAEAVRWSVLPLMAPAERHQLLAEWNDRPALPDPPGAWERFARRAVAAPEAVAVVAGGSALTYGELRRRSERLAAHLAAVPAAEAERLVAVAVERSEGMLVAILGVLASGAAYVPLDPEHPRERLGLILEDARPDVLLTQAAVLPRLPEVPGVAVVEIDRGGRVTGDAPEAGGDRAAEPPADDGLAYAIFTSGSTGRPKGVAISRAALASFVAAMEEAPGLAADDVMAGVTTLSFDMVGLELFLPFAVGARLVVIDGAEAADGHRLMARLERERITVLQATPATWRMLLDAGWTGGEGRTALLGGEALPAELARELTRRNRAVWNLYGPTESTVWSTVRRVEPSDLAPTAPTTVSLGRCVHGTRIVLADPRGERVPLGVAGEVLIGGPGLARGYLGRPRLTAAAFVPDPLVGTASGASSGAGAGARLYRTGDLARWRAGGDLEYLGRLDHQVKIRGFRIELGEIEAALLAHPEVGRAVAVARGEGVRRQLAAYVVAAPEAPDGTPPAAALRAHLEARVPAYMVPAWITLLPELPLTPSGKVDRRALPEPAAPESAATEAPRDGLEELVAGLFSELLEVDRVGVHASFFELGGHSLLATRLVSRLRRSLGVELTVTQLFETPTVAGVARAVGDLRRDAETGPPPLAPMPREERPPLSFAQERLWFIDRLDPGSSLYNLPAALRLEGELDAPALAAALGRIVRRHEALRTTFAARDGRPYQVIRPGYRVRLPVIDLSRLAADPERARREAERLATGETGLPFDLEAGPLLRARLLRLAPEAHLLLVSMHHIVSDGWSMGVLVREVAIQYRACRRGEPSPLPALSVQYADFARWQKGWLRDEALEAQLGYWRRTLADARPLALPTDRTAAGRHEFAAADLPFTLSRERTRALEALARRGGASPFMVLLAAYAVLLGRHAGRDDVVVGTPVANRNRAEVEELIGFFVNTLALRVDLSGNPSFEELVARVREATLGAYDHQDLPFARVVEELDPDRRPGVTPFAEAMLAVQNHPMAAPALDGLRVTPLAAREGDALRTTFLLALRLRREDERWLGGLGYNADLFERATAERWRDQLVALLEAVTERPERRLDELELLLPVTRRPKLAEVPAPAEPEPGAVRARVAGKRAELSSQRDALSEARRRLLEQRLRGAAAGPARVERPGTGASPSSPLVEIAAGEGTARPPLFLVHAVGGTLFSYRELARLLAGDGPVFGLQAPGVDGAAPDGGEAGEPATVEALAARYVGAVRSARPDGPYLLGGWSFGGVVAFEMARRLRSEGADVPLLVLLDSRLPAPGDRPPEDDAAVLSAFFRDLAESRGEGGERFDGLAAPAPGESIDRIVARAHEEGLLARETDVAKVRRLLAVFRAHLSALYAYRPGAGAPYPGRVDLVVPGDGGGPGAEPWRDYAAEVAVHALPGDHYSVLARPHVERLAALWRELATWALAEPSASAARAGGTAE